MDETDDPLVGRVLDGRYEILARHAGGGQATVYRARDRRLGREVAIKIMHDDRGEDTASAATFDREAKAAARLHDATIVSVFDQGEDRGRPFIVMEYVDGCTLRTVMTREGRLPPARALAYLEPIAIALAVAHDAGLIHRDVKPENVLISTKGEVKVGDFGLARPLVGATSATTSIIGTVSYLSPERAEFRPADKRSDVYSTGVVLFEMLTGVKPYQSDDKEAVARAHRTRDVPAPSTVVGAGMIPPWLDELVIACTRRDPALRPLDGADLLQRIRRARAALAAGTWDDPTLATAMNPYRDRAALPAGSALARRAADPVAVPGTAVAVTENTPRLRLGHDGPPDAPLPPDKRVKPSPTGFAGFRQERKYRRRRAIVAGLVVLLVAGLIGVGAWWFTSGRFTDVPDVTGRTQAEALTLVHDAYLTIEFEQRYSEDVPAGQVISTTPTAGERARRDSTVHAFVSKGPERYAMPAVVGKPQQDAQVALTNAHLAVGEVTRQYSETVLDGVVISASAGEGEQLKPNTPVALVVSQGREPIPVASYVGQGADEAEAAIAQLGLVSTRETAYSDTVKSGVVISQTPDSGTLFRGDPIALTVSKGPEMVKVPNIKKGDTQESAQTALTNAGLKFRIAYETNAVIRLGLVGQVEPGPGTSVRKGSEVTLHIV